MRPLGTPARILRFAASASRRESLVPFVGGLFSVAAVLRPNAEVVLLPVVPAHRVLRARPRGTGGRRGGVTARRAVGRPQLVGVAALLAIARHLVASVSVVGK